MSDANKITPVILCGGSGTRLWPISHEGFPKQFHNLIGESSLLQQTLERAVECTDIAPSNIITVTSQDLKQETLDQINSFDPSAAQHLISEPCSRNTAPAIANAALYAKNNFGGNTVLWIMPSDHYIQNMQALRRVIDASINIARQDYIVTLGISPDRPETGYGYIKAGNQIAEKQDVCIVDKFVEKPDYDTAQKFLRDSSYSWNSGMFIATADTLIKSFEKFSPDILLPLQKEVTPAIYRNLPTISFDKAIMEKTEKAAVLQCDIGWSDIGSWESLWRLIASLENKNNEYPVEIRPWGKFKVLLQSKNYKIKEVTVQPGQSLSLQQHEHRSEFWTIVVGKAKATIGDETKDLNIRDNVFIPAKTIHRLENTGAEDLIIIEAQCGEYLEEDDITRFDDIYGRRIQ